MSHLLVTSPFLSLVVVRGSLTSITRRAAVSYYLSFKSFYKCNYLEQEK